jgi:hypothetical protein
LEEEGKRMENGRWKMEDGGVRIQKTEFSKIKLAALMVLTGYKIDSNVLISS